MATPPPGSGGSSTEILGALSDPATLLAVKEFNTRLGQLEESVQKFGARIALTTQEQFLSAIRKLKEETFSDLKATKEYLNDLDRAYEQIGTVIEERIKGILKEGVALQENTEKSTEALTKAIDEVVDAYENATPAVKKFYDELGGTTAQEKLQKINELTHENYQNLDNSKIALEAATKALADRNSEFDKAKRNLEELAALEARSGSLNSQEKEKRIRLNNEKQGNIVLMQQQAALLDAQATATSKINAAEAEQEKLRAAIALQEKHEEVEILEITNEKNKAQQKILELKKLELAATIPLAEIDKMRVEGLKDVNSKFGSYLEKLSPGAKDTNIFASAMLSLDFATKKTGSGIKNLTDVALAGMKEAFLNPQAAANSFFNLINDKLIKSTFEFDSALASVNRETGGFRKEFEQIATSSAAGGLVKAPDIAQFANLGMTLEKVGKVYGELSKSIMGFNAMSKEQRENLTKTAAELNLLGISTQTFSALNTKFMTSFGVSAEQASRMMKDVAKDAIGLGQDVAKYAEGLNTVMSKVSGYGREATEIYKQLQGISQATKGVISAADLTAISDKFATFDTAADAVSKLNSMLGTTSLNIMDMMQKDPAEQIMAIKRAATDSGLEFDKLNIGYKRLLAEYFGGDINKAAAFFKMDLQEANNLMNKASATEKELEERKQASVAAQEKMKATMDQFMLSLTPLVNIVNGAMSAVNSLVDSVGVIPVAVGVGLLAFYRVRAAVTNIKEQAIEAGEKFKKSFDEVKDSIDAVVKAIEKMNANLSKSKDAIDAVKKEGKDVGSAMAALDPSKPGGSSDTVDEIAESLGKKKGFLGKAGKFLKNPLVGIALAFGGDYLMENADKILGVGGVKGSDMIFRSAPGRPPEKIADVPSTEVIDFKGAYKNGPLDKMTNFIAGTNTNISNTNLATMSNASDNLSQSFFSNDSPMVSTMKEFNRSVANSSNAVKEATMSTFDNENFKQVVESTKDVQKMAAEKIATEKQTTTNNFTSAINNSELMSREVVNNTQSAVPKDLKMSSTLNINLGNKFIDAITEEVVSKMHSTV